MEATIGGAGNWLPGVIAQKNCDGTYSVDYLDGRKETRVEESNIQHIEPVHAIHHETAISLDRGLAVVHELQSMLTVHDVNRKPFERRVSNSLMFSALFQQKGLMRAEKDSTGFMELRRFQVQNMAYIREKEQERRQCLDEEIARMKGFDRMIEQSEQEREEYRKKYQHQSQDLIEPFHKQLLAAHLKRRKRQRAKLILLRFIHYVKVKMRLRRAVRLCIKARYVFKRKAEESEAASMIQRQIRRKIGILRASKLRHSRLVIQRIILNKKRRDLARARFRKMLRMNSLAVHLQSRVRGYRARRMARMLRQQRMEDRAVRTIQSLYRRVFERYAISRVATNIVEAVREDDMDEDVMILQELNGDRPPIEQCRGYWIEMNDCHGKEGLVVGVDLQTRLMIIEFGDRFRPDEYEVAYDSREIVKWYKMASQAEQMRSVWAAIKIQSILRARIARRRVEALKIGEFPVVHERRVVHIGSSHDRDGDDDNDDMEPMVLRCAPQPGIVHCKGYWVLHNANPDNEALVEKVDIEKRKIEVEYSDSEMLVTFSFDDPDLNWFRMSTEKEQAIVNCAATKIQAIHRGR